MTLLKAGMVLTLIVVMALIGVVLKWGILSYGVWVGIAAGALGIWIAGKIDESDARKATGSQLPGSRGTERELPPRS